MIALKVVLFICSWLLVGFLSFCIGVIIDMRGNEFDDWDIKNYVSFYYPGIPLFWSMVLGYLAPVITLLCFVDWDEANNGFIKFLYDLANPGKEEKDAGTEDTENSDTDDK